MKKLFTVFVVSVSCLLGCTSEETSSQPDITSPDPTPDAAAQPDDSASPAPEATPDKANREQWSEAEAAAWYAEKAPLLGFNYVPRTAINQLEMWQAETWDPDTIDEELSWAGEIGLNTARVFLHDLLWEQDSEAFLERIEAFLAIAESHEIGVMFVFFDGVWHPYPRSGPQPDPIPGVHNSQWVQSPGAEILADPARYDALEPYVTGVIGAFRDDPRVVVWDLFNEPNNPNTLAYKDIDLDPETKAERALELLTRTTEWALSVNPTQPLTAGVWDGEWGNPSELTPLNAFMLQQMDVVSFHTYVPKEEVVEQVQELKAYGRPMLCTEYIARPLGNTYQDILPLFTAEQVGAYQWGFVNGRSQTIYAWWTWVIADTEEPDPWFHDLLREDGTPYDPAEIELIQQALSSE